MERFRVVVAGIEPHSLREIQQRVAARDDFAVVAVVADGREAIEAVRRLRPDLLFFDMDLASADELRRLRRIAGPDGPEIVFLAQRDGAEVEEYEVEALDYLLKPCDRRRVEACLERVRRRLRARAAAEASPGAARGYLGSADRRSYLERFLARGRGGGSVVLSVERVDWLEADDNYVILHVGSERYRIRDSLRNVDERLDPSRFARVHRSAIVNLDRVREVLPVISGDFELVLANGERVRLSRTFRRDFEERVRGLA